MSVARGGRRDGRNTSMLHTAVPAAAVGAALFVLLLLNIEADRGAVVQMIRIMVLTS